MTNIPDETVKSIILTFDGKEYKKYLTQNKCLQLVASGRNGWVSIAGAAVEIRT